MPTYDVVADLGADNSGGSTIDSAIDSYVQDNTTLQFPPGTYRLNSLSVPSGISNFELVAPDGATLVPQDYGGSSTNAWIDVAGPGFRWDNFEIEVNGANPGAVRVLANDWELTRLVTRGQVHAETDGQSPGNSGPARSWFRIEVPSAGSTGLIEDCYFHDGSGGPGDLSNRRAILIEQGSGDLTVNRCWFESWGENTIYAIKPEGKINIYNCYAKNTQNPYRVAGHSTVWNCVSVRDAHSVYQGWSGSALQTGVRIEAEDNTGTGINTYDGTLEIFDCDFSHRYVASGGEEEPTGACVGGARPPQRIDMRDLRMSFNANRNQDCVYNGSTTNQEYWNLENIHIKNDSANRIAMNIGQQPDTWDNVSGVIGGSNTTTSGLPSGHNFTIGGNPTAPNLTPPLPSPSGSGVPMANADYVVIDNTGQGTADSYTISANSSCHPSGRNEAPIDMTWGTDNKPQRNDPVATGSVPAGEKRAFYAVGGVDDISTTDDAAVTVNGQPYAASIDSLYRYEGGTWVEASMQVANADTTHTARPLKRYTGSQWVNVTNPAVTGITVVDDFEDNSLSEYTQTTANTYSIVSNATNAHGGNYYCFADGPTYGASLAYSTSGLNQYPTPGDTMSIWFYPETFPNDPNPNQIRLIYGFQDLSNYYGISVYSDSTDRIEFRVRSGGSNSYYGNQTTSDVTTTAGWYNLRVDWEAGGTHTATLINPSGSTIATTSMTDSTYTSGGVGYYIDGQTEARLDDFTIQ